MKCPHCGAELQENARFCLYCMQTIQEKTAIPVSHPKKRVRTVGIVLTLLAVGVLAGVLFAITGNVPGEGSPPAGTAAKGEKEPITDSNWFYFDAIEVTEAKACQGLWEPSGFYLFERAEGMEVYRAPVYLQNAGLQICFIDGGAEIFTAVTSLTQDTLADGVKLADCIAAAIYYGVDCDVPDLTEATPSEPVAEGDSCLAQLQIDDPAAMQIDPGTKAAMSRTGFTWKVSSNVGEELRQQLTYELRTRTYEGVVYYDIFLLCRQG